MTAGKILTVMRPGKEGTHTKVLRALHQLPHLVAIASLELWPMWSF